MSRLHFIRWSFIIQAGSAGQGEALVNDRQLAMTNFLSSAIMILRQRRRHQPIATRVIMAPTTVEANQAVIQFDKEPSRRRCYDVEQQEITTDSKTPDLVVYDSVSG